MSDKPLLKIGLTGGLASGKSTVAHYFAELGIAIIDADKIARELALPTMPPYHQIIQRFGKQVVKEDGTLDRQQLRTIIFHQPEQRHWLEKLLHPLIRATMQQQLAATVNSPYCILVIPLLVETSPHPLVDRVLVIDTSEELQLARAQQRDQLTTAQVLAILQTQVSRQQRLAAADDIIANTGDLSALKQQVVQLHHRYLQFIG